MFVRVFGLIALLVLGLAMDLKGLQEKVEQIHNSPFVVMSLVFDSDKSMNTLLFSW